jgi:hypothetical protein
MVNHLAVAESGRLHFAIALSSCGSDYVFAGADGSFFS